MPKQYVISELMKKLPYRGLLIRLFYDQYIEKAQRVTQPNTYFCGVLSPDGCLSINKVEYTTKNYYWDEPYVQVLGPTLALACISSAERDAVRSLNLEISSVTSDIAVNLRASDLSDIGQVVAFFPNVKTVNLGSSYVDAIDSLEEFGEEMGVKGITLIDVQGGDAQGSDVQRGDAPLSERVKEWLRMCRIEMSKPTNAGYIAVEHTFEDYTAPVDHLKEQIARYTSDALSMCDHGYYVFCTQGKPQPLQETDRHDYARCKVKAEISWVLGAHGPSMWDE